MAKIDAAGNDLEEDKVFLVKEGFLVSWFCAPKHMSIEQVQEAVDDSPHKPGTSLNRWVIEHDSDNEGERLRSPGFCAEDCGRQHWKGYC